MNTQLIQPTRRTGGRKARRSKRGSVLILIVALLVLMALIGTAWISSARVDRAATIQHASNTEIELLVDGVVNMAKSGIIADASANGVPRGPGYVPSDSTVTDKFL